MIFNIRRYIIVLYCLIYALLLTTSNSVYGVQIIRLNLTYDNTVHVMDIELFDDVAPLTVANYLDYVTSLDVAGLPKFDGTFIYRNVPGFVLQTGGYTFRPPDPLVNALIKTTISIPADEGLNFVPSGPLSPVANEFNQSNLRGTIAMARFSGQPDSATSEWFINLSDNSFLDTIDGGFTVFGRIIDDGMQIADEISTFPSRPYAGVVLGSKGYPGFDNLPVVNYDIATLPAVLQEHLVMITTIRSENIRPILRFAPRNVDFGLDVADGIAKTLNVVVTNTGNEVLNIDPINSANLSAEFTISNDGCSNAALDPISITPTSSCSISYSFNPVTTGNFTATLPITYSGALPNTPSYSVTTHMSGEGVPQSPVLDISNASIQFTDTLINTASGEATITIRNKGGNPLSISSTVITGSDSGDFVISTNNCITPLLIDSTCVLGVSFNPIVAGVKNAVLSILSNGGNIDIPINGMATIPAISVNTTMEIIAQTGYSTSKWLIVTNTGTADLTINTAVISGTDSIEFTQENNCPDTINQTIEPLSILSPGRTCKFLITFTPTTSGTKTASLTLTSNDPVNPSIDIALTGLSGYPSISAPNSFDVGTSQINGYSSTKELIVTNTGDTGLVITNIFGLASTSFSQTNDCIDANIKIAPNSNCSIFITFSTTLSGSQSIVMALESNDPANPSINVTLNGFGDNDSDGVLSSIEASSPNSGDGNNDNIADDVQNNVATLISLNSNYITFVSDNSVILDAATTLVDVRLISAIPTDIPVNAVFSYGLYNYSITLPAGDGVNLGILLPANEMPDKFYKYGPTTENTTPHWYNFSYDQATGTGAQFYGKVTITSTSGVAEEKNLIMVRYIDGLKGDDDLEVNGAIINTQSGISFSTPVTDSGSLSYLSLLMIMIMNIWRYEAIQQNIRNVFNRKLDT